MPTREPAPERILVGVVAKAHGLRGEVVVEALSDAPGRFDPGSEFVALAANGTTRPLVVRESRPHQDRLLVRFDGFTTREEAEAIHGAELTIGRDQVAPLPEGRYYRFELEGLRVAAKNGAHLGVVTAVFGTGANDVIAVKGAGGEILIPLLPEVILSVDVAGGSMVVDPPPGLPGMPEGM